MKSNNGPERLVAQMKSLTETSNGFRITSKLLSSNGSLTSNFMPFKAFINDRSGKEGLKKSGEFYFNFEDAGFTGIVCFEGSHISIHTNPQDQCISLELFLSDRILNNINISDALYQDTVGFFASKIVEQNYQAV